MTIGVPIGSCIAGPLMDKFGRKKICLFSCIPQIISWLLLLTANTINLIYISRFIAGFSSGLTTVGLIYVSEITHPRIRPMMLSCNSVFVSFGILITCCLPVWLNWLNMAILFLIINCLTFIGLFFIPESPYWSLCFNKMNNETEKAQLQAENSLKWLNRREKVFLFFSKIINYFNFSRTKNFFFILTIIYFLFNTNFNLTEFLFKHI